MRFHRRRGTTLRLALCVFLAILAVTAVGSMTVSASDTIVVDPGEDTNPDTIQEGINEAADGDTVLVKDGTYTESVVVNKSVHVVADVDVIVDPAGDNGFTIVSDNAEVDGFTITNAEIGVVIFGDVQDVVVRDNQIPDAVTAGILADTDEQHQSQLSILGNEISNQGDADGISVAAGDGIVDTVEIDGNEIINEGDGEGIFVSTGDGTVDTVGIAGNEIGSDGAGNGILFYTADGTIETVAVEETLIANEGSGQGVLFSAEHGSITNVSIHEVLVSGGEQGIAVSAGFESTHDATVESIEITDSGVTEAAEIGLFVSADGSSTVTDVTVDTVAASQNPIGIAAYTTADGEISGMSLSQVLANDSDEAGLATFAEGGTITDVHLDSTIVDNNTHGIQIGASNDGHVGDISLENIVVQESAEHGLFLQTEDSATLSAVAVRESLLRDNAGAGVLVNESAPASELSIHYSFIARNAAGVSNENTEDVVDARLNYWGNGSGPSSVTGSELVDPVTEKPAYGSGDAITAGTDDGVANVRFSPAIGAKADQRDQMQSLPELADDDLAEEFEFEVEGISIADPISFAVEGETVTGKPSDLVGISVWERAVLPLRTDRADGATVVDLPPVIFESDDGDVPANLDALAAYNVDDTVTIDFEQTTGAQTDRFAETPAHMIVIRADSAEAEALLRDGDFEEELMSQLEEELQSQSEDGLSEESGQLNVSIDGIEVVAIQQVDDLDANGETSTTYTPDEPGEYAFLLGTIETGDGFTTHDEADLSFNVFNDTVAIVGAETMTVQRTSSSVDAAAETNAGVQTEFTADSNLGADTTAHAILAYDKAAFEDETVRLDEGDVEELSNDVFRLTSGGERAGKAFFLEVTVDTSELEDGEFKLTIHGTVSDSDGTFEAIIDEDGDVEVLQDDFDGDELDVAIDDRVVTGQIDGIDFTLGVVTDGDSTETLTMPLGEFGDIAQDETETYQWIHAAVDQDDTTERSSSTGTIDVAGPTVTVVDASLNRTAVETDEDVALSVDLENPGSAAATDDIVVTVDGADVQTREVTLDGGESATETFTLSFADEGEFEVAANNVIAGTVTVADPTDPSPTPSPSPSPSPSPTPVSNIPTEFDGGNTSVGDGFVANNTRFNITLFETDEDRRSGVRFTSINATTTRDIDVAITATRTATSPDAGAGEPPTNVGGLTYLQLGYDQEVADSVDEVEFNFRVSKDRLDQLGQESGDVALYRYDGGEWTELSPEQVRETDTHYHYRADSPGLSLYATSMADPDIQVTEASLSATEIDAGDSVTVNAEVENNGGSGEETVDLVVDGEVRDSQTVQLSADETTTVAFEPTFEEAGEYDIAVNDVSAGTLSVVDTEDPTDPTDPDDPDEGISVVLIAIVLVVALALAGTAYYVLYYQE